MKRAFLALFAICLIALAYFFAFEWRAVSEDKFESSQLLIQSTETKAIEEKKGTISTQGELAQLDLGEGSEVVIEAAHQPEISLPEEETYGGIVRRLYAEAETQEEIDDFYFYLGRWTVINPAEVSEWLNSLPSNAGLEPAIETISRTLAQRGDYETAFAWADAVQPDAKNVDILKMLVSMAYADGYGDAAWLDSLEFLSEEDKLAIQTGDYYD